MKIFLMREQLRAEKRTSPKKQIPTAALFDNVRKEARNFFPAARGSHGWDHTERVLRLCLRIGKREKADLEILALAAVLHDIGRPEEDRTSGKICHSEAGAALARKILAAHGVEDEKIAQVVHCIETHRFRKKTVPATAAGAGALASTPAPAGAPGFAWGSTSAAKARPLTKEAKILFDADKLDSIGAVGIGRAFLFAGEVGARLHNKDRDLSKTLPYTREDTAFREFMVKLRWIKDRMHTAEGRRIAAERHKFMVDFFDRLNKETDGAL
jgi:uncharacterized protein